MFENTRFIHIFSVFVDFLCGGLSIQKNVWLYKVQLVTPNVENGAQQRYGILPEKLRRHEDNARFGQRRTYITNQNLKKLIEIGPNNR